MASSFQLVFTPAEVRVRGGICLTIREYSAADFHALLGMYESFIPKRVAQGLPPLDRERIGKWLRELEQKSRALLAWDEGRVVGHAILCPISRTAVEFTVFVHQDNRGEGLGTALTRLAIMFAHQLGFVEVFLCTELSNLAALHVYRKVGFTVTSCFGEEVEMKLQLGPGVESVTAVEEKAENA